MALFRKKNGDYFVEIIKSQTKTEADIANLLRTFDEHKIDGIKWQGEINAKIGQCPEKEKIDLIDKSLAQIRDERVGMSKLWKAIYIGIATAGIIAGIAGWIAKFIID